jgi:hypothetical protein
LETFEHWVPLDILDTTEWIRQKGVETCVKKCANEFRVERKNGRRGNKRHMTDLGQYSSKRPSSILPELQNTRFTIVIHWVSHGKHIVLASNQLQALYTDTRHCEELIDFIDTNGGLKEPYNITSMFKCTMEQDELDK